MTDPRTPATAPWLPSTLGIRHPCRTSSTARPRWSRSSTVEASPGPTLSTVIGPPNIRYQILYVADDDGAARSGSWAAVSWLTQERPGGSAAAGQVFVSREQRGVRRDVDQLVLLHPVAEALPGRLAHAAGLLAR